MSESLSSVLASHRRCLLGAVLALLAVLLLTSCSPAPSSSSQPGGALTIAAASDLAPLSDALTALIRQETGQAILFSFASSGSLTRQIEHGAPFDIFLSANEAYVTQLAAKEYVEPESVRVYALGRLGLWYREGKNGGLAGLLDPKVSRVAIPNPDFAPYGVAAKDLLVRAGMWEKLESKIVYGENVRHTAQFASSGNVDAAISSWTTIQPLGGTVLEATGYAPIRQAGAVVSRSAQRERARQVLGVLTSPAGIALLREHGFEIPK